MGSYGVLFLCAWHWAQPWGYRSEQSKTTALKLLPVNEGN